MQIVEATKPTIQGPKFAYTMIAVAFVTIGGYSLGLFDVFLQGLKDGFGPMPAPSIDITKSREQGPAAKFGYITVINLSNETVKIKHVSVNHRKDAVCSFGAEAASLGGTPILEHGHNIMLSTVGLLLGACGSIFVVSVNTDRGSADFNIDWR